MKHIHLIPADFEYFNFDDFKTFSPYSSVELYIPFVGYVTLKNADILKFNGTFYGRYLIDLINGYSKFQLYTYIDANGNVINPATLNDTQKELFRFIIDICYRYTWFFHIKI